MDLKNNIEKAENLLVIKECLIDYAGPILIVGNINWLMTGNDVTIISATMPKENFVILNNNVPNWVKEIEQKANDKNNILIIKDLEKVDIEKQGLLIDILKDNQVSTKHLPSNLKIVLNASEKCNINFNVRDIVECYEI